MNKCLLLLAVLATTSCGKKTPASTSFEVTGNVTQRIAAVVKLLSKKTQPPGTILDANFLEEKTGDGELGPSDYSDYFALTVPVDSISKWKTLLKPLPQKPNYTKPTSPITWWISAEDFTSLEFYQHSPLFNRGFGWVGISTNSNKVYIHTETN